MPESSAQAVQTRPLWLLKASALVVAWGGFIYVAAVGPKVTGPWNLPSMCGPWGCTAETDDLMAYHLVWLAVTVPAVAVMQRRWPRWPWRMIGGWLFVTAVFTVVVTVIAATTYWQTQHATPDEPLPWRYGFYLLFRNADLPVLPTLCCGAVSFVMGRRHNSSPPSTRSSERSVTA